MGSDRATLHDSGRQERSRPCAKVHQPEVTDLRSWAADERVSVTRTCLISPARLPFWKYRSVSHGGDYALGWNSSIVEKDFEGVLLLVRRVNNSLQREARRTSGLTRWATNRSL